MTIIRSYTTIEQSKILAEFMPLESADMHYYLKQRDILIGYNIDTVPFIQVKRFKCKSNIIDVQPAWSLTALLNYLSENVHLSNETGIVKLSSIKTTKWCISVLNCGKIENCYADEPIDACVAMVEKLHELNLL